MKQIPDAEKQVAYNKIYGNITAGRFDGIENDIRSFLNPYMLNATKDDQIAMATDFVVFIRKSVPLSAPAIKIAIAGARISNAVPVFVLDCGSKIYGTGLFMPKPNISAQELLDLLQIKPGVGVQQPNATNTNRVSTGATVARSATIATPVTPAAPIKTFVAPVTQPTVTRPVMEHQTIEQPVRPAKMQDVPIQTAPQVSGFKAFTNAVNAFFKKIGAFVKNLFSIKADPEPAWKPPVAPVVKQDDASEQQNPAAAEIVRAPSPEIMRSASPALSREASTSSSTSMRSSGSSATLQSEDRASSMEEEPTKAAEQKQQQKRKQFQERMRKMFTPKKVAATEQAKAARKTPRLDKVLSLFSSKKKGNGGS